MKKAILFLLLSLVSCGLSSQDLPAIKLNKPDLSRGYPVMKAFSLRASASEFPVPDELNLQDLSDLLWAANGINRLETGKRTAPTAMNAQDIDIYVCAKSGIYLYDAKNSILEPVAKGDYRKLVADRQENFANAPMFLVLVSDISRFRSGEDSQRMTWAAEDAAYVSGNIGIFCAATDLITRPRATMDQKQLQQIMKLKESQHLMLNNPVGYRKK
jgi:hypothetical protein